MYHPLQFFTLLQASTTITSLVKTAVEIFPEARIVLVMATASLTFFGWLYWFLMSGEALHTKAGAGAIIVGAILGIWL